MKITHIEQKTFRLNGDDLVLPDGVVGRDYELIICGQHFAWENSVDRDTVAAKILKVMQVGEDYDPVIDFIDKAAVDG